MLQAAVDAVQEFHTAKNVDFKQLLPLASNTLRDFPELAHAIASMRQASKKALKAFKVMVEHSKMDYKLELGGKGATQTPPDYRFLRFNLVAEEASVELLTALMDGDEISLLDALADAVYVIIGTALTYDLPLEAAFAEVHRSNMTKKVTGARLEDKGSEYSPPDLARILREHRNGNL